MGRGIIANLTFAYSKKGVVRRDHQHTETVPIRGDALVSRNVLVSPTYNSAPTYLTANSFDGSSFP